MNYSFPFRRFTNNRRNIIIISIFLLIFIVVYYFYFRSDSPSAEEVTLSSNRSVTLASVADLSANTAPLPLLGTVTSESEATIRAESSGKITVYKKLGDYVTSGEVIAEFDNAAERASVLSAQGAYDGAKAGLGMAKINSNIAEISTNSSGLSLEGVKTQALNTITSAYITLDDAVRTKTDPMFANPRTRDSKFTMTIPDAKLQIAVDEEHQVVEALLEKRAARNQTLRTEDDLVVELATVEDEVNQVKNYLDDLSRSLSIAIPDSVNSRSTIDAYKTVTGVARASVAGTLAAVTGARSALNASISGNKITEKSLTQSNEGSTAVAEAGLLSASGGLQAAKARLEKTIVRSPISGTINSLSFETGDFVSPYTEIAVVSNNGTLEIVAYITEDDAKVLKIGSVVLIGESASGIILHIAPALDPKTRKIEVRVGITSGASSLVNGQSVQIIATRTIKSSTAKSITKVPLSALKITPTGTMVFTVSASSTLIAHVVTEGTLLGDSITITGGLTPDMNIVTDARGLQDGMSVNITK